MELRMPKESCVTDFNEIWGEDSDNKGMKTMLLLQ